MRMYGTNNIEILLIWLSNARILWDGLIMFKYNNEELKYIYEYDYGLMVDWKKFESGYKL